ncbi:MULTISPECIES: hypothetical protein [Burkholderia]|uniref:hypothetical protein n=1 Tax=Burkholderia TaxID=32008 RepID=UPI002AAFBC84|nr:MULTISPECIES: hypothetical protein [Burkholderia]
MDAATKIKNGRDSGKCTPLAVGRVRERLSRIAAIAITGSHYVGDDDCVARELFELIHDLTNEAGAFVSARADDQPLAGGR